MQWYYIVLITLGVLVVLYFAGALVIGYGVLLKIIKPVAKWRTHDMSRPQQIRDTKLDFEKLEKQWNAQPFTVTTADKLTLRGVYIDNPNCTGSAKVAIVVHGHTANLIHSYKYADIFYNLGYNVVMYDSRYFGDSDGKFDTLGQLEKLDLSLVVDFARNRYGKDCFLALHGESMGAATVLLETAVRSDIDLVVADCPFSDSRQLYGDLMKGKTIYPLSLLVAITCMFGKKYGYDLRTVNPIEAVRNTDIPIMFIHGDVDTFIPPYHSRNMAREARNSNSLYVEFPNAKHASSYYTDSKRYIEEVTKFVQRIEKNSY